jgi:hypothetical protein
MAADFIGAAQLYTVQKALEPPTPASDRGDVISPRNCRMSAVCEKETAGVDVNLPLQIATLDASIGRRAPVGRTAGHAK